MSTAVVMQYADNQDTYYYATVELLLGYNNGNTVFHVVRAGCYKQDSLKRVSCREESSAVQFCEVAEW
jgi:hypothetical protein